MINTLSKLSSIDTKQSNTNPLRFNGSLPINIEVLEILNMNRYKLLLGTREFTTRSQKNLEKGKKYWGSFGENKDGIITISNLTQKPKFLQNNESFLDIECSAFLEELKKGNSVTYALKEWVLNNLAKDDIKKETFKLLSQMLLALKDNVIHLPLKHNEKPHILQFKAIDNYLEFYLGFENIGPIKGNIFEYDGNIRLDLEVYFEKSLFFLQKELEEMELVSQISINKNIQPIYKADKMMLNLQG